jgi:hypothetical protein
MALEGPESIGKAGLKKHRPFLVSGLVGLAVILMSLTLMAVFPAKVPELPQGFLTPIIAFEFIQDKADVNALFGPSGSPARENTIRKMDLGNRLDFGYMILYGSFLFILCLQTYLLTGRRWFLLGSVLTFVILGGDMLENVQLLGITALLSTGNFDEQLRMLHFFTWLKWGGIVVVFLILVPSLVHMGRRGKIICASVFCALILGIAAFFHPGIANELFSLAIMVIFLLTIFSCLTYTLKETS